MKKFVLWTLVVAMFISMSIGGLTTAVADADVSAGDIYYLNPEGWPTKHWEYMTEQEIATYEANGWERCTGVHWYDEAWNAVNFDEINTSDIQNMYNKGYTFHVIYHWLCPAQKLNKYEEQSVYVGRWVLSPAQAEEFNNTYVTPGIAYSGSPSAKFVSQWYYESQACSEPLGTESEAELKKFTFVRDVFDVYVFGYGSQLYLKNGEQLMYTYSEAIEKNEGEGFHNEMIAWN